MRARVAAGVPAAIGVLAARREGGWRASRLTWVLRRAVLTSACPRVLSDGEVGVQPHASWLAHASPKKVVLASFTMVR